MEKEMWIVILRELIVPLIALVVVPLVTAVLSALMRRGLALLEQRWGFEVNEKQKQALDQLIMEAVLFAEEQGRKRLAGQKDTMTGAEKMQLALQHVKLRSQQLGLGSMVQGFDQAVRESVEAKLFQYRQLDPYSGASGGRSQPERQGPQLLTEDMPTAADVKPLDSDDDVASDEENGGEDGEDEDDGYTLEEVQDAEKTKDA